MAGLAIPERYGGAGGGAAEVGVVMEELGEGADVLLVAAGAGLFEVDPWQDGVSRTASVTGASASAPRPARHALAGPIRPAGLRSPARVAASRDRNDTDVPSVLS